MRSSMLMLLLAGLVSMPACSDALISDGPNDSGWVVGEWDVGYISPTSPNSEDYWGLLTFQANGWVRSDPAPGFGQSSMVRYTVSGDNRGVLFDGFAFIVVSSDEMRATFTNGERYIARR